MSVMTHIAPPVCGCVVTPIITRVALCVIIFFGCCTYIVNLSLIIKRFILIIMNQNGIDKWHNNKGVKQ